jgi:hypothetical protein
VDATAFTNQIQRRKTFMSAMPAKNNTSVSNSATTGVCPVCGLSPSDLDWVKTALVNAKEYYETILLAGEENPDIYFALKDAALAFHDVKELIEAHQTRIQQAKEQNERSS